MLISGTNFTLRYPTFLASIHVVLLQMLTVVWKNNLKSVSRKKRSTVELGIITQYVTGLSITGMAQLNLYGCWCGVGGGGTPKDAIDQ